MYVGTHKDTGNISSTPDGREDDAHERAHKANDAGRGHAPKELRGPRRGEARSIAVVRGRSERFFARRADCICARAGRRTKERANKAARPKATVKPKEASTSHDAPPVQSRDTPQGKRKRKRSAATPPAVQEKVPSAPEPGSNKRQKVKSAYGFFDTRERREEMKASYPQASGVEIGKMLRKLWKKMGPKERKAYTLLADNLRAAAAASLPTSSRVARRNKKKALANARAFPAGS